MNILHIRATENGIRFTADQDGQVEIRAYVSAFCRERPICTARVDCRGGQFDLPCRLNGRDGRFLYYAISCGGEIAGGAHYVEDMGDALRDHPYPTTESKKGLQITMIHDAISLGVKHAALNVNLGSFVRLSPDGEETIPFEFDGETFYFSRKVVEGNDTRLRELTEAGVIITLILLNSQDWGGVKTPDEVWDVIRHPDFCEGGRISAFNLHTPARCGCTRRLSLS